jgi:endonuclease/exonuclease/phosphatase family metal-dependent hydrolase
MRNRQRLVIAAISLGLPLFACKSAIKLGSVIAGASLNTVSVMTFNIFHDNHSDEREIPGWSDRKDLVVGTIKSEMPDVVGLQEALLPQVVFLVQELPKYDFVGRGRNADTGGESVSIMFRNDRFELVDEGHFWFSDFPDIPGSKGGNSWGDMDLPRMTTWVRLRRKETGKSFYVYNTHLASDGTADDAALSRSKSVELLVERIADREHPTEYFMVTGDFNATDNQQPIKFMVGETPQPLLRTIDAWRAKNEGEGGTRCRNNGTADGDRIDYIFIWNPVPTAGLCDASSGLCEPPGITQARTFRWGPSCASDHRATIATFTIRLGGEELVQ